MTVKEPITIPALLLMAGLTDSLGEGVRKIKEGAVKINGCNIVDWMNEYTVASPAEIRVGNTKSATVNA